MSKENGLPDLKGKILGPEDSGFNDPRLPWSWPRNLAGWERHEKIAVEIHGSILVDQNGPADALFLG